MVDADATRAAFNGLFERPPLTDQLLQRPPFKFLIDVINATINQTGYLKDEFSASDLDINNLQDKTQKIAFLDRLIKILDDGSLSQVKSAKIVAGKEPELTNLMLIKLAENARSYASQSQSKENNAPVEKEKKKRSSSKDKNKDKDHEKSRSKDKERNGEKKERSRSHDRPEKSSKSSSSSKDKDKEKKEHRSRSKDRKDRDKDEKKDRDREKRRAEKKSREKNEREEASEEQTTHHANHNGLTNGDNQPDIDSVKSPSLPSPTVTDDKDDDDGLPLPPPPEERERQLKLATAGGRPQTSMGRPGTAAARPAPPKIKKKHIATTGKEPEAEIIGEGAPENAEENEDFLVEEEHPLEDFKEIQSENALLDESERGALVQKIVSTKQELEEGTGEMEEEPDDDMTRNIEREKISRLQAQVQEATRTAFPISRTMDYAQEDLESMMRELEKWRAEVRKNEAQYQDKMANQKSEAFKLTSLLTRLDDEIREVKHQLTTTKKRIVDLEARITIMIVNI